MSENSSGNRIHPLVAGAAVSVILACGVGIAAMTGLLPSSGSAPKTDAVSTMNVASGAAVTGVPASTAAANAVSNSSTPAASESVRTAQNTPVAPTHHSAQREQSKPGTQYAQNTQNAQPAKAVCEVCGVVESVRAIEQHPSQGSGVGAVAGALLGGVLGNQVGGGNGQKLATVAGAVGGGFAGNAIEKRVHTTTSYEIRVRMENGSTRTFHSATQPDWQSGDHVRVVDGALRAG